MNGLIDLSANYYLFFKDKQKSTKSTKSVNSVKSNMK